MQHATDGELRDTENNRLPDSSTDTLRWIFCQLTLNNNGLQNSSSICATASRLRGYRHPVIEQASNALHNLLN